MSIAKWSDSYKTGNALVDHQHQELFRMINAVHDATVAGQGPAVIASSLESLKKYVVVHFTAEEALMCQIRYPGLIEHEKKHRDLILETTRLIAEYKSGKAVLSLTLARFLGDWLKNHINAHDKALIRFAQEL